MIKLGGSNSVDDIERKLGNLETAQDDTDLLLPTTLRGRNFGGMSATLQLIISWRRKCPRGRVRIYLNDSHTDEETSKGVARFVNTDHGMLAAAIGQGVWTQTGSRDLSDLSNEMVRKRLSAMDSPNSVVRGPKFFVGCFDDTEFDAPQVIYRPQPHDRRIREPELVGSDDWTLLAHEMDSRLWSGTGLERKPPPRDVVGLGVILRELIKNTHDWARSDVEDRPYDAWNSVRGFRIERLNLDSLKRHQGSHEASPLGRYISHPDLVPQRGRQRFLELSVFDSGPGLASRELRETSTSATQFSVEEEERALRKCLRKHYSSSFSETRGMGLARVLAMTNSFGGLLRIRTGRRNLYRNFISDPYREDANDEPFLLDWLGETEFAPAPFVVGTFVTAILPVRDEHR